MVDYSELAASTIAGVISVSPLLRRTHPQHVALVLKRLRQFRDCRFSFRIFQSTSRTRSSRKAIAN